MSADLVPIPAWEPVKAVLIVPFEKMDDDTGEKGSHDLYLNVNAWRQVWPCV